MTSYDSLHMYHCWDPDRVDEEAAAEIVAESVVNAAKTFVSQLLFSENVETLEDETTVHVRCGNGNLYCVPIDIDYDPTVMAGIPHRIKDDDDDHDTDGIVVESAEGTETVIEADDDDEVEPS